RSGQGSVAREGMTGRIWCCCTTGSPKADSTPQTPSMTERSTPKSFSMRENSGAYSFAFSLPAMMRQSDHAPIEILPELLVEFGLIADRLKAGGVGAQPAHDAVVCVSADAAAKRLGAERSDPLGKIAGSARPRRAGRECR